jgi:hypothetical protein
MQQIPLPQQKPYLYTFFTLHSILQLVVVVVVVKMLLIFKSTGF